MNMKGEVVGVMSYVKFLGQNINFATDVSELKKLQDDSTLTFNITELKPMPQQKTDSLIILAKGFYELKKYDSAIDILMPLIKYSETMKEDQVMDVNHYLAKSYFFKDEFSKAFTFYDRFITLLKQQKPPRPPEKVFLYAEALFRAGMCEYYLGAKRDSKETIEQAIWVAQQGIDNDSLRRELYISLAGIMYNYLGMIKIDLKEKSEACINFKQALEYGDEYAKRNIEKYCGK